jgi:hypothetical protein
MLLRRNFNGRELLEVHKLRREEHNSKSYLTKSLSPLATATDIKSINKIYFVKKIKFSLKVQGKMMNYSLTPSPPHLSYKNQGPAHDFEQQGLEN